MKSFSDLVKVDPSEYNGERFWPSSDMILEDLEDLYLAFSEEEEDFAYRHEEELFEDED